MNLECIRHPQEEIINTVLRRDNVLALLPTGAGKSICFQVPALIKSGICIVISPLISLMENQVKNLNNKGIKAIMCSFFIRILHFYPVIIICSRLINTIKPSAWLMVKVRFAN